MGGGRRISGVKGEGAIVEDVEEECVAGVGKGEGEVGGEGGEPGESGGEGDEGNGEEGESAFERGGVEDAEGERTLVGGAAGGSCSRARDWVAASLVKAERMGMAKVRAPAS